MRYKLKVYSIWEFGQRKDAQGAPHQEDSMFPAFGKQQDSDRLFILCDGMGGHDAGEVASATVCEAMSGEILGDKKDSDGAFTPDDFKRALTAAYDALDAKDSGAEKKMGTTLAFLKLDSAGALIAHIGDSRVYQIRPGKTGEETEIVFQTEDHSLVNDLVKVGELTREEARQSKQKNVITRAMQPNMDRRCSADIHTTSDIRPGDYFYLCSDGMLEQPEMEDGTSLRNVFSEMGGPAENKVEILRSVTENNRDNHTAFIIHILEVTDTGVATVPEPAEAKTDAPASPKSSAADAPEGKASDKFTAIVEEEPEPQAPAAPVAPPRKPKPWRRYVVAAVGAAAVVGGVIWVTSAVSHPDKPVAAEPVGIPSELNRPDREGGASDAAQLPANDAAPAQENTPGKDEAQANGEAPASENAASQPASGGDALPGAASAAGQSAPAAKPTKQEEPAPTPAIKDLPAKLPTDKDVVQSDEDRAREEMNRRQEEKKAEEQAPE